MKFFFYLQPLTLHVSEETENLEISCLSFILQMHITSQKAQRASIRTLMMPIRARRRLHLVKAAAKFYAPSTTNSATSREKINWEMMSPYSTVSSVTLSAGLPSEAEAIPELTVTQLAILNEKAWADVKK